MEPYADDELVVLYRPGSERRPALWVNGVLIRPTKLVMSQQTDAQKSVLDNRYVMVPGSKETRLTAFKGIRRRDWIIRQEFTITKRPTGTMVIEATGTADV